MRPSHLSLLREIVRFNREAPALLEAPDAARQTMGDFLDSRRFGESFTHQYLFPMASAIWSASLDAIRSFPAFTLIRFFDNHGLLSLTAQPKWKVVAGGSNTYIPRLTAHLSGDLHLGSSIHWVQRGEDGVTLAFRNRPAMRFDEVVFACHGDQVLPLLADPTDRERDVFQRFLTTTNVAWLHTDDSVLPVLPRARASWNYRLSVDADAPPTVTYDLNRLQGLTAARQYCVTLNPNGGIDERRVLGKFLYRHPLLPPRPFARRRSGGEVSGVNRTHYCGAYWRYGFHEDGLTSALRVPARLESSGDGLGSFRRHAAASAVHARRTRLHVSAVHGAARCRSRSGADEAVLVDQSQSVELGRASTIAIISAIRVVRSGNGSASMRRATWIELPDGPIFLLTHLRYLGYGFNPVSFFYCFDRAEQLQVVLAEVSNTFGGTHHYWLRPDPASRTFRAAAAKALYVSPFMPPDLEYTFAFTPPAHRLVAHMETSQAGSVGFDATLSLERRPWNAAEIRRVLVRYPQ
jgi:predicted NAD/FAD-binding protein